MLIVSTNAGAAGQAALGGQLQPAVRQAAGCTGHFGPEQTPQHD